MRQPVDAYHLSLTPANLATTLDDRHQTPHIRQRTGAPCCAQREIGFRRSLGMGQYMTCAGQMWRAGRFERCGNGNADHVHGNNRGHGQGGSQQGG